MVGVACPAFLFQSTHKAKEGWLMTRWLKKIGTPTRLVLADDEVASTFGKKRGWFQFVWTIDSWLMIDWLIHGIQRELTQAWREGWTRRQMRNKSCRATSLVVSKLKKIKLPSLAWCPCWLLAGWINRNHLGNGDGLQGTPYHNITSVRWQSLSSSSYLRVIHTMNNYEKSEYEYKANKIKTDSWNITEWANERMAQLAMEKQHCNDSSNSHFGRCLAVHNKRRLAGLQGISVFFLSHFHCRFSKQQVPESIVCVRFCLCLLSTVNRV